MKIDIFFNALRLDLMRALALGLILLFIILLITEICIADRQMRLWLSIKKLPRQSLIQKNKEPPLALNVFLFGEESLKQVKQSRLAYTVVGIFYSKQKIDSQVILRDSTGEERVYIVGDTLPDQAIIKKIKPKEILIFYQGNLERLRLAKNHIKFEASLTPLLKD